MVIAGLQQLERTDVISVIREEEEEVEEPQVFISYQWESQEEVVRVRQYLEECQVRQFQQMMIMMMMMIMIMLMLMM